MSFRFLWIKFTEKVSLCKIVDKEYEGNFYILGGIFMKKNWGKCLAVALILCLVGAFGASLIQSDFGRVEITDVVIRTSAGEYTGYLFVPDNATAETPAPAIVTSHGYLNNREM